MDCYILATTAAVLILMGSSKAVAFLETTILGKFVGWRISRRWRRSHDAGQSDYGGSV